MNAIRRKRCCQREKSAGQPFGDAHQIGNYGGSLAGKHAARSSKAGKNFVCDQQYIVSSGQAADSGKKFFGMNDHPARALQQRLDNNSGNFVAAFGEHVFEFL